MSLFFCWIIRLCLSTKPRKGEGHEIPNLMFTLVSFRALFSPKQRQISWFPKHWLLFLLFSFHFSRQPNRVFEREPFTGFGIIYFIPVEIWKLARVFWTSDLYFKFTMHSLGFRFCLKSPFNLVILCTVFPGQHFFGI